MLMKFEFLLINKIHYNGHDKTTHFITQIKTDILKRAYNVHLTYTGDSLLKNHSASKRACLGRSSVGQQ